MDMESEKVCSTFPEGSFQHLFWKQQMEACLATTPQQRRWHLLLIKWLLKFTHDLICSLSQSPHIRHVAVAIRAHPIRDYSNVVKSGDGFKIGVLKQLFPRSMV